MKGKWKRGLVFAGIFAAMVGVGYSGNAFAIDCGKVLSLDDAKVQVDEWVKPAQADINRFITRGQVHALSVDAQPINTSSLSFERASWQTDLLVGTTNFIKDRAEKEIIVWFTTEMLDRICAEKNKDYFKSTCEINDSYKASLFPYGKELYSSMKEDLERMPGVYQCNKTKDLNNNGSAAGYLLTNVILQSAKNKAPVKLLAQLGEKSVWQKVLVNNKLDDNFEQMLYVSGVLLQASIIFENNTTKEIAQYAIGKITDDNLGSSSFQVG